MPKFRLISLLSLIGVIAFVLAVIVSHRRVDAKFRFVERQISEVVQEVSETVLKSNTQRFKQALSSEQATRFNYLAGRNGRPDTYLSPTIGGRSQQSSSIGGLESKSFQQTIDLVSYNPESLAEFLLSEGSADVETNVHVDINCISSWRLFAGTPQIEITLHPSQYGQEFCNLLGNRLEEQGLEFTVLTND